jgi:uncharacterized protein (TIGR00255 family)
MSKKDAIISSMTGFGRGEVVRDGCRAVFELSSVNSRFLEVSLRLPRWLMGMEAPLRAVIDKRLSRGKVFGQLTWERADLAPTQSFNEPLAEWYIESLKHIAAKHASLGQLTLGDLVRIPDLWGSQAENIDATIESVLNDALSAALDQLIEARRREGQALAHDLAERIGTVENLVGKIRALADTVPAAMREKLNARIQELFGQAGYDPQRLAQEVAYMAERADITEECVRLLVHTKHFVETLSAGEAAGRRLNFLMQEMNREANTIGSKSASSEISTYAVGLKEELERIREQVQNIE